MGTDHETNTLINSNPKFDILVEYEPKNDTNFYISLVQFDRNKTDKRLRAGPLIKMLLMAQNF